MYYFEMQPHDSVRAPGCPRRRSVNIFISLYIWIYRYVDMYT